MRKIVYVLLVVIVASMIGYLYIYKDHRNIEAEKAVFTIQSNAIINEFSIDNKEATQKYLNKTIIVIGGITEISGGMVLLEGKIICYMSDSINSASMLNSKVKIKGRFIGYDELLDELKIDQASIVK